MANPENSIERCGTCINAEPLPVEQIEEMLRIQLDRCPLTHRCRIFGAYVGETDLPITSRQSGRRELAATCYNSSKSGTPDR